MTGMSGTGKSTVLAELGRRGFPVVETDSPAWSEWIPPADGAEGEWLWLEDRIQLASVEPLVRATWTHEIDATRPLADVVDALISIGQDIAS